MFSQGRTYISSLKFRLVRVPQRFAAGGTDHALVAISEAGPHIDGDHAVARMRSRQWACGSHNGCPSSKYCCRTWRKKLFTAIPFGYLIADTRGQIYCAIKTVGAEL